MPAPWRRERSRSRRRLLSVAAVVDPLAQLLADLEEGERFGFTCTASPVRGLRPSYSRRSRIGEAAEAANLDAVVPAERVDHRIEDVADQQLRPAPRQLEPVRDDVDEVGLGHGNGQGTV